MLAGWVGNALASGEPLSDKPQPGELAVSLAVCKSSAESLLQEGFQRMVMPGQEGRWALLVSSDGKVGRLESKIDGELERSTMLARFVGSFKTGQPATAIKKGGTQWIEWKVSGSQEVLAVMKEDAMNGPACGNPFTDSPVKFADFLAHLEKEGKVKFDVICHKWEGPVNQLKITPLEDCVLPLPAQAPARANAKPTLLNISGFVDVTAVKDTPAIQVLHRVVCPWELRTLPSLHPCNGIAYMNLCRQHQLLSCCARGSSTLQSRLIRVLEAVQ